MNLARPLNKDHVALIDLTPMIDVVFLLIVFFMTTAQFASMSKERLELPKQEGETQAGAAEAGTVVNLRATGEYVVSGDTLTLEALLRRVAADIAKAGSAEELDLLVRADRGASAAHLNDLAEGLAARGVTRWRLATERPASGGGGAP